MDPRLLQQADAVSPQAAQAAARKQCGYGPIQLLRDGDCAVVLIQVGEAWVEIQRAFLDCFFDDTIYPLGIVEEIERRTAGYRAVSNPDAFPKTEPEALY